METKICSKCGRELPLSEFYKNKTTKDGASYWCKKCNKKDSRRYYAANKEKIAERNRKYGTENKGKLAEYRRKYQKELYAHYIITQLRNQHIPINETTIELQRNRLLLKRYIREQTKNA